MTMTKEQAFSAGLELVRGLGVEASGKDIAVIAAHNVFCSRATDVNPRPIFPTTLTRPDR